MNLLILGLNYAPEPVGIGPYTAGMAQALAQRGHAVSVVCGRPYYPDWKPFAGSSRAWRKTIEHGVQVTRCPHYIPAKPTGLRRILHHLSFAASALIPALRRGPDVVFVVAPSLLSVPVAWLTARLSGARLWVHVQDFEVEAAFATGLLNGRSRLARLAAWVERRIFALADIVSTISPQMIARLSDKGVPETARYELRNWANHMTAGLSDGRAQYRREWALAERKVALYSGNIANKQGLDVVIAAARLLRDRDDIAFVICGQGPNRDNLERLASGLPNMQFHDLQPASRIAELLGMAHVHLLPQRAEAADLVLPSKLTNMLASARPVIATAAPGTGLADEVDGCGIVVPPEDAQALADAVCALCDDPDRASALGQAARVRAEERWSRDAIIDGAERRMLALVSGGAGR